MTSLRVAVTGSRGQIVRSLLEKGAERGVEVIAVGRPALDLADTRTVHAAIASAGAQVVVNAAGFTNTEDAEVQPGLADAINARGAGAVAASARALGIPVIHLSSAYVFDGRKASPYLETDAVNPLNAYGHSKLAGEQAVAAEQPDHVILRSSLVYGPFSRNFLTVMLKLAANADEVRVVEDQFGSPSAAFDVANGILTVAQNLVVSPRDRKRYGVFHIGSSSTTVWADLAAAIFEASAEQGGPHARVVRIASCDYNSRVERPVNSSLDCAKIDAVHAVRLPPWRDSLPESIARALQQRPTVTAFSRAEADRVVRGLGS